MQSKFNDPPIDPQNLPKGVYSLQSVFYDGKWYVGSVNDEDWSKWMVVREATSEDHADQLRLDLIKNCWDM